MCRQILLVNLVVSLRKIRIVIHVV
jgi:hypothetical protein